MSHTITVSPGRVTAGTLTVVDYPAGGETVNPSDVNAFTVDAVILGTVPSANNSLGVVLFPLLNNGKVMLFRFVSGAPVEIPTTTALNAKIPYLISSSAGFPL